MVFLLKRKSKEGDVREANKEDIEQEFMQGIH